MTQVFGRDYADSYDLVYRDKDYAGECDMVEHIFRVHGDGSVSSVLDLGCGTGNHAAIIAQRGYEVLGVDRSESMLAHARQKVGSSSRPGRLDFRNGDIRSIDLGRQFDATLIMFAVLGYQLANEDVLQTLQAARRHLRPGGLLIFDAWYGPAVLHQRPAQRIKVITTTDGKIIRVSSGEIDVRRHLCMIEIQLYRLAAGRVVTEAVETHAMRCFFPLELDLFLECAGFTPIRLGAFPDFAKDPDETTWNCLGVARAV